MRPTPGDGHNIWISSDESKCDSNVTPVPLQTFLLPELKYRCIHWHTGKYVVLLNAGNIRVCYLH